MTDPVEDGEIRVWDPFLRVFHWSLASLIGLAWLTEDGPKSLHEGAGYVIVALLAARLVWGFVGPKHARFSDFLRGPGVVLAHLHDLARGRERRYLGHNPAGGWMIVALIVTISATALTGWLQTTDRFWGSTMMEETHECFASLILVLLAGHLCGVLVESLHHRENLVRAMITGRKRPLPPLGSDAHPEGGAQ
ncbi:cytochrome b/b6 domain-containing protein [Paracoccus sp. MBLB3053]|uniref:Cytochrome b/b6 domain-containing protein n=1 Tax=Paracoccus aurantius TaxID=3073814 RepID=A0ABU2HW86_9RHOB|nr:cytochrome b/b6 domain-containing protein [Paracoccus sp. MBLB3053]MDS9468780.1 cytochrome b/b6 domain-containing protein [Paracoccus sp. MBLB3053]